MNNVYLGKYFKDKKVFLTGHTGFKGAWMLQWLHLLGAEVKGYALAPENENNLFHIIQGETICDSVIADIRDKARLEKEILAFKPDYIFHLAAQPLVRLSYQIPTETFEVNVMGTANVLNAMRQLTKPCQAVFITTDKVYENQEWHYPYRENDRLGGYDPYSASKAAAELIIGSYRNSFFNPENYNVHKKSIASARAGNVIGGGDWSKDRIIPDIVRALNNNETILVRNPEAVRPWQHVLEPLGGYLLLACKMTDNPTKFADAWNFGPLLEDCLTVRDLVHLAIKSWGSGKFDAPVLENQPHEAGLLKLDISKSMNEMGWKPRLNSEQAIELTLNWYKCFKENKAHSPEFTKKQIVNYAK